MARDDVVAGQSGWVSGLTAFAGTILVLAGIFQGIEGFAAILRQGFYIVSQNYAFYLDTASWGWLHLIIGIVLVIAGFAVFSGSLWAKIIGILIAVISAIANFFFIPYYPVWSILIIVLDIAIIWALAKYRPVAS